MMPKTEVFFISQNITILPSCMGFFLIDYIISTKKSQNNIADDFAARYHYFFINCHGSC